VSLVCLDCQLLFCDEANPECRFQQFIQIERRQRQTRTKVLKAFAEHRAHRSGVAKLGFKKYDRRRKPDTPQRAKWRAYKRKA
jgi:hypothetical protein